MSNYNTDPTSDERFAWSALVMILLGVIVVLAIGYFAWWVPSQQPVVVVPQPTTVVAPGPQGPAGAPGAPGASGPSGPSGPAGAPAPATPPAAPPAAPPTAPAAPAPEQPTGQ